MPTLTERELSNVEKLFNATRALLNYTRAKRKFHLDQARQNQWDGGKESSAMRHRAVEEALPVPMVSPSSVLDGTLAAKTAAEPPSQQQPHWTSQPLSSSSQKAREGDAGRGSRSGDRTTTTTATGGSNNAFSGTFAPNAPLEKRLWAELAFVFWRIAGLSKLTLLSYVTSDPCGTLEEVGKELLDYIQGVFNGCQKRHRLEEVSRLGADHVLYMLKKLCSRRTCVLMLGGDSVEGKRLHKTICRHVVERQHVRWMSLMYVAFCDEAAHRDEEKLYMPSTYVSTASDVLRSLYRACGEDAACAHEMLNSEPVSCVTYLFYGLKLRIQRGELLRPSEADDTTLVSEGGADTALPVTQTLPRRRTTRQPLVSRSFTLVDKYNAARTQKALAGAAAQASAYAATAAAAAHSSRPGGVSLPEASSAGPSSPMTGLDDRHHASPAAARSSSWGMNRPFLTRQQLGQLILAGRQNCFDELCHLALDVVVEAVRNADGYHHWAIMSTIASVTALSVKGIEEAVAASAGVSAASANKTICRETDRARGEGSASPPSAFDSHGGAAGSLSAPSTAAQGQRAEEALTETTKQVAMYENVLDVTQLLMAFLKGLTVAPTARNLSPATRSIAITDADAVVRGSVEAMNALQQSRETFLQELMKCDFATHLKTAMCAAPQVLLADRSLMYLVEEFCTLDKSREEERQQLTAGAAAAAWQGSPYPAPQPLQGLFEASNLSFQAGTSFAAGAWAGGAASGPSSSFGLGGGRSGLGLAGNVSIAVPSGARRGTNARLSNLSVANLRGGMGNSGLAVSTAESGGAGTPRGALAKDNFAKSLFKNFFRGKKEAALEDAGSNSEDDNHVAASPGVAVGSGIGGGGGGYSDNEGDGNVAVFSSTTRRMAAEASTWWSEVPSYVAIVKEMLGSLNDIFVDPDLDVELRMTAGFILPPICLRDAVTFEMYKGRVTICNLVHILRSQVQQHVTSSGGRPPPQQQQALQGNSSGAGSAKELSTSNFIGFVHRALLSLERAYNVIQVPPLTSEAVALTELPLFFFCADGVSQPGMSLEKFFMRVTALWAVAITGAESDEDLDKRSMEVLLEILQRARHRGSVPRDAAVAAGGSSPEGKRGSTSKGRSGDRDSLSTSHNSGTGGGRGALWDVGTSLLDVTLPYNEDRAASGGGALSTSPAAALVNSSPLGANSSLFGNGSAHFLSSLGAGVPGGPAVGEPPGDTMLSEHTNTLVVLSHVCMILLHREPALLSADALGIFFSLFLSHDTSMARLGRECVLSTFDLPEAYGAFANIIRKEEDVGQVISLVALLASYVGSDKLHPETRHERRVWLAAKGCVDAVIRAVARCLQFPQLYATTVVKLVPQLFRLLSAFEPSQDVSPQLCETDFVETISQSIEKLQGTEYFIIVTQSMLDAATCNFGFDRAQSTYNLAVMGNFRLSAAHCAAVKTIFLELVPALARYAAQHGHELYTNLLEVFIHVVRFSGSIHSARLVEFALDNNLSELIPHMEVPVEVLERLPFSGASAALRSFWCPILTNAPARSEVRFTTSGGVALTLGQWPEKGLTLSFCIKYDSAHTNLPLLEMRSHETPQLSDTPALLSVSGGDSVQLAFRGVRSTVNQRHAPQSFKPGVWLHVSVAWSCSGNTLAVYLNGLNVGVTPMPYFTPGTEASLQVGLGDKAINDAFFSVGEITVWGEELSAAQVEAHLAGTDPVSFPPKVLVQEVPRELGGTGAPLPIDERIAHYTPCENENKMLRNVIKRDPQFPIIAKIVGRHAALPQRWIDYHMLWATRGGILETIRWLNDVSTSEELEMVLRLVAETTRRVTLLTTMDARMYLLLAFMLKRNTRFMSKVACDNILYMGTAYVAFDDEDHCVILNRLLFEYILSDCAVLAKMPLDSALHTVEKVAVMFNPNICRYAKRNAQFILPHRFVDRLLNTLVNCAVAIPIPLRMAIVGVAKQVLVACEMEESVLSIVTSMCAVLTPMEQQVSSVYNTAIKVTLPTLQHARVRLLPLRTAENVSALLLRSLVESSTLSHNMFAASFPRVVSLNWLTTCLGRFADPVGVVYALWLFLAATQASPALKSEVMANQQTIVDALQPHAVHADVVLILLAFTLGAAKHLNLLSQRFSVREQLDSVLSSFVCSEPNAIVAPIFVKVFIMHLHSTIRDSGERHLVTQQRTNSLIHRHQRLSYRVRRYFSLARVCSRLMLLIHLKRYQATAQRHMLALQWHSRLMGRAPAGGSSSFAHAGSHGSVNGNASLAGTEVLTANASFAAALRSPPHSNSFALPVTAASATVPSLVERDTLWLDSTLFNARLTTAEGGTAASVAKEEGTDADGTTKAPEREVVGPEEEEDVQGETTHRVRSRKYKRAFAVLRVCVLLWIPTVVSRYDWVLKPQAPTSERELTKRHASTLFAVKAFRKFANQPSLYHTFVSSPMQTAALSSLVNFISKPLLQMKISEWELFLEELSPVPAAREVSTVDDHVAAAVPRRDDTAEEPAPMPLSPSPPSPPFTGSVVGATQRFPKAPSDTVSLGEQRAGDRDPLGRDEELTIPRTPTSSVPAAPLPLSTFDRTALPSENDVNDAPSSGKPPARDVVANASVASQAASSAMTDALGGSSPPPFTAVLPAATQGEAGHHSTPPCTPPLRAATPTTSTHAESDEGVAILAAYARLVKGDVDCGRVATGESFSEPPTVAATAIPRNRVTRSAALLSRQISAASTSSGGGVSSRGGGGVGGPLGAVREAAQALSNDIVGDSGSSAHSSPVRTMERKTTQKGVSVTRGGDVTVPQRKRGSRAVSVSGDSDVEDDDGSASDASSSSSSSSSTTASGSGRSSSTSSRGSAGDSLASSSASLRHDLLDTLAPDGAATGSREALSKDSAAPAAVQSAPVANSTAGVSAGPTADTTTATPLDFADARDPSVVFIENPNQVVSSVGDVVRREAVGALASLISAALHVLPLPHWVGGLTYGSCGGLLFQMLLITSSTAPGEESSLTLIRYFLFTVAERVKEEQGAFPGVHVGPPENAGGTAAGANAVESNASFTSLNSAGHALAPMQMHMHDSFAAAPGAGGPATPFSPLGGTGRVLPFTAANGSFARGFPSVLGGGSTGAAATAVSDVFYFNVIHFTELVVDMISINVLDLPTANNYFLTLLVLCQSWPKRHMEQLSGQVLRTCIAVLNRPSTQEATVGLIESIYTLTTLVLRRGYMMKGAIDCLLRVLYRVYASLPPGWMSEADAQRRKDLIVLIFRYMMRTYATTKELQKALQVRTLTQRFTLYNDFAKTLLTETEAEACEAFGRYCEENASSMTTLMAGRPKQKADMALKANIRLRSEYIKRVKNFNASYLAAVMVKEGQRPIALRAAFHARLSSYIVNIPVVEASQLHWLTATECAMRGRKVEREDGSVAVEDDDPSLFLHYFDAQRNYATVSLARSHTGGVADDVDVMRASLCEEQVNHIGVLVPPLSMRCRPFLCETPPSFISPKIRLSPSALTLLRLLLHPNETLRFISNAFRINGIHATPCLVLLTNFTLKVISFSRVTQEGDIILSEFADPAHGPAGTGSSTAGDMSKSSSMADLDEASGVKSFSSNPASGYSSSALTKEKKHNAFSISKMTKQIQRLLLDDEKEERRKQLVRDGTRVAQSVRQSTGQTYRQLFWMYMLSSLREVRCVHYMHLDTAVLLATYHDDGPMLSFVDATQSMNPAARAEFLSVLKEVVRPSACAFVEDAQRSVSLRTMLVRWATGAVSNYEYLAFLNRAAGRTIKDFNQYPVFPWILRDYSSRTLDLESASTFRDLAFPMGAQTDVRRATVSQFYQNTIEMWQTSEEAQDDGAACFPFHHGTHYSTSGGVLYYLIRVEPFTTFAKLFQGGDFDVATRLFDSVAASYSSCVLGPADCKELLPEFYYNNMFLCNADHVDFGTKADGEPVDNVKLPPWAKGSVQVFTAVMRYALESGFVLHHIHQWIDLIFGVRRRGPLAQERCNVFQRMTYGEEVRRAIQKAVTPHEMDVIIAEVDNFGQTPMQLFQERHPSHHELEPVKSIGSGAASATGGSGAAATGGAAAAPGINTLLLSLTNATGGGGEKSGTAAGGFAGPAAPGATSANLANPSVGTAAGQTYTVAFTKESPTVMRMMVHALDTPQVHFRLTDIPASRMMPSPPPCGLADYFRGADPGVTSFATLRVASTTTTAAAATTGSPHLGGVGASLSAFAAVASLSSAATTAAQSAALQTRLACGYRRMIPVEGQDYFVCWHERESRLMRFSAATGRFHSLIPFDCPEDSGQRITAVSISTRESLILVAVTSGTIYCLYPGTGAGIAYLNATLCYHTHPVAGFAVDAPFGRAISFTRSPDDMPIVWRVQRSFSSKLFVLNLRDLLPCLRRQQERLRRGSLVKPAGSGQPPAVLEATPRPDSGPSCSSSPSRPGGQEASVNVPHSGDHDGDLVVVHACIDHGSAFSVLITKRSLFIFDNNGLPFGAGSLPMPPAGVFDAPGVPDAAALHGTCHSPLMLEDEDGEIGYVAEKQVPFVANMTVVLAYHTMEWAGGMQLFLTGHQDGSLALWRSTRLPPDMVEPGRIAVVDYHATIFAGAAGSIANHTAPLVDLHVGPGAAELNSSRDWGGASNPSINLGAVTAIQQEKPDVPHFLVGFQSGATRLLTFDDAVFQPDGDASRKK